MSKIRSGAALIPVVLLLACAPSPGREANGSTSPAQQGHSLLGRPLLALPDTFTSPASPQPIPRDASLDSLLGWGRAAAARWRYRDALELYSRAIELAPMDWRGYRHRGHRYISLRRFDDAVRDLERAHALDSIWFDVEYHRALAHYLLGHFDRAAEIYGACMAQSENHPSTDTVSGQPRRCADIAVDDDSRVAMTDWRYRALRRAGRAREAAQLLESIREGMAVRENLSYYENLRRYAGRVTEGDVLAAAGTDSLRLATSGYGLANYRLAEGDTAGARAMLERLTASPHWPAFAVIAAEADLARLDPARARSARR